MTAPAPSSVRSARFVAMLAADPADGAGRGAHDDAFGRDAVRPALDPLQQRAVGDTGGREDAVALGEVFEMVDAVEVLDAPFRRPLLLVVVAEQEAALELAADAAQSRGGEHALRRA